MAAARVTGWDPSDLVEMTSGEIIRWIQARLDADELIDEWFDFDTEG